MLHAQALLLYVFLNPVHRFRYRHIPGMIGLDSCRHAPHTTTQQPVTTPKQAGTCVPRPVDLRVLVCCPCVNDAGPAYRPIFGNLPEFRDLGSHEFMAQCHKRYGPIFKVWFGHRPWIVVCDADVGK